jgi:hypothetical protein
VTHDSTSSTQRLTHFRCWLSSTKKGSTRLRRMSASNKREVDRFLVLTCTPRHTKSHRQMSGRHGFVGLLARCQIGQRATVSTKTGVVSTEKTDLPLADCRLLLQRATAGEA